MLILLWRVKECSILFCHLKFAFLNLKSSWNKLYIAQRSAENQFGKLVTLTNRSIFHIKEGTKSSEENEEALDEGGVPLIPAAFFSSAMLASSSWTRLMFLSLSSATSDTCADIDTR